MDDCNVLETLEKNGYKAHIMLDEYPEDPRERYEHDTVIVDWSRDYDIGDRKATGNEIEAYRRGGIELLTRYLSITKDAHTVVPLRLLDHSGLRLWIGDGYESEAYGGWDSGQAGFAYITRETVEKHGFADPWSVLASDVQEMDSYLSGDVYGIVIVDPYGQEVDSYWGFIGAAYALESAHLMLDDYADIPPTRDYLVIGYYPDDGTRFAETYPAESPAQAELFAAQDHGVTVVATVVGNDMHVTS
jgi:hypothetical protein